MTKQLEHFVDFARGCYRALEVGAVETAVYEVSDYFITDSVPWTHRT